METVNTTKRLGHLRELMKAKNVDLYIVPSEDSHQSEYIAPCDGRREFISGFSGSAGCAVVTADKAALATDGRYFNQAQKQLDSNWTLLKQGMQDVLTWQEWTAEESKGGKTVGVDPTLITAPDARKLAEKIKKHGGVNLVAVDGNLVDQVWGMTRPARPREEVKVLGVEYAGKKFGEKLEDLRKELEKKQRAGFVVGMLDEIAWLFNLRGNDIPYNPVFFSYAIVTPTKATLYVDSSKVTDSVRSHLDGAVELQPYEAIMGDVEALAQSVFGGEASVDVASDESVATKFLISTKTSWALSKQLGGEDRVEEVKSPIADAKAIKNDTELAGMRACHVRDGAALIEYFAWLEEELLVKSSSVDEVEGADKLEHIRSKHDRFVGLSFDTISSTGANAAVIHYKPERGNCAIIDAKAVYLCDSGAQYLDGTTDTTRTLHFGEPTAMERKAYTLVLKGNMALDKAVFPKGTSGFALDALARQFLWEEGLDYRHGTGHGNVHEGPIGVGSRIQYAEVALAAGNVLSDEPGYYEDGSFGIRIESETLNNSLLGKSSPLKALFADMVLTREAKTTHQFGEKPYLSFEHVTMVPMCRALIDEDLLTVGERKWLDSYHAEVREKTRGFFEKDERSLKWLERETCPI
ncbi:MAG: hypothetical protein M1832_005846 [Thelocarpon impressellum]|nr:MAG: hypothetical protein M1832_005846 [Thelocarpon impressellum]